MRIIISTLIIIAVLAISYLFGINNENVVSVNYLIAQGDFKLSWVVGFSLVTGFLVSWLVCAYFYFSLKLRLAFTKRKLDKLEQQQDAAAEAN